ncbi:hypothetical protein PVAND_012334 [Polypedilum vanderplanki]|uniref:Uncharacterized protein n=1 Tax=Polypedilum vanderplanki TaxID=319348 RepID=A0A9J6CM45_POLVA|nr:hypothetical protein PVAND_012334 [Polypedilum vanderplanki]
MKFALFVLLSLFADYVSSIPVNKDFLSPEEYEALKKTTKKVPIQPSLTVPTASRGSDDDAPPIWGTSSISSANAQSVAHNVHGGKEQQAGANSYNNNIKNEHGNFHNSGASSIGSNLSEDGKTGQLSSANVQKQTSITADGYKNQESSQSQSANFDQHTGSLQTSNANTDSKHTIDKTGEKKEVMSGSAASNQNQFGNSNSQAQSNTVDYNQNGMKGSKTDSTAQSSQINKDGSVAAANTHSGTNTYLTADGKEVTESKAGSSSFNQGQNGQSASSSNCGSSGAGNKGAGAGGGYSFSSSSSSSSSSSFGGVGGQQTSSGCQSGSVTGGGFPNFPQNLNFPNPGFGLFPQYQQYPQYVPYG